MKKSKIIKRSLIIFGIVAVVVFVCLNSEVIKATVIATYNGQVQESLSEETEELVDDAENYTLVESADGYTVPVPTGYTASSIESETYVNGIDETYAGTKIELTFSSDGEYPWKQNEDGVWVSGNTGVVSSTSTLTSEQFTVGKQGGRLTVNWTVSCYGYYAYTYLYAEIKNVNTGETIRSSNITNTKYGTSYDSLIYTTFEEDLKEGTYTLSIIYYKSSNASSSYTSGLDSGYVKSANVISYDDTGTDSVTVHKYGGFVIYEGDEAVTEDNVETAQTTRNQWVWVPVDSDTIDRIYYSESSSGTKTGKSYTFSVIGRTLFSTSNEPAILTSDDIEYYFTKYGLSGMTRESFYQELQVEFENTIESIKKYGGFYIGRYETGNVTSSVPVVQKMNTTLGGVIWYEMYSKMGYLGANTYVKTNMIWGCLWDETLQWLVDSGSLKQDELLVSMSWGNYYDSSVTYTTTSGVTATTSIGSSTIIPAGSSEDTKVNNIYDMAGNVWDWTLEVGGSYIRYLRGGGGYSNHGGSNEPASYRDYNYMHISRNIYGSRAYLYIQ